MTNRPQATFLFLVSWALAPLAHAQSVVRGPYLQSGTPNGVTVLWRTNLATDSMVRFGSSPGGLTQAASSQSPTTEHGVSIDGLLPDTRYYYSVGTASQELAGNDTDYFFVTSPVPGESKPTRIWVIGDSGTADDDARAVRDSFLGFTGPRTPDLWLMLGDNAYPDGTDAEYQAAVFNMYPGLLRKSVLWPTLGNHDAHEANSASQSGPYYEIFDLPTNGEAGGVPSGTEAYYSFDYGDIHIVCLDSAEGDTAADSGMMMWLAADLLNNDKHWLIVFWHHPPYSKGSHNSDGSGTLSDMREDVLPILEDYGVDLVLSGHSHSYERSYLIDGHLEHAAAREMNGSECRVELPRAPVVGESALPVRVHPVQLSPLEVQRDIPRVGLDLLRQIGDSDLNESERSSEALVELDRFLADADVSEITDRREALVTRARARGALGRFEEAAEDYTRAIATLERHTPEYYLERSEALVRAGLPEPALRGIDEGVEKAGHLVTLELRAIELELTLERYDGALVRLETISRWMPEEVLWFRRGEILRRAGRTAEARHAYEQALGLIETAPVERRSTRAHRNLAQRLRSALAEAQER